jgi:1,4-alpha-glucan branching enzyme
MAASKKYPSVSARELERLFALAHHDPHTILGARPTPLGVLVRAWRPEAVRVELLVEGEGPREMTKSHPSGLFELLVEDRSQTFPYQLRTHYAGGVFTHDDPYRFLPTVSPFDEHLFGEGRHLKIYDKLGAHVRRLGDVRGTSFAVWAPFAEGVSVVGSFNNWDGRLHQMRKLGTSGVWELFVPGVGAGALYKFEIHRRGSPPLLKADPYARQSEVPPATSSIVFESSYRFADGDWMERRRVRDHLRGPLSIYEVHLGSWRRVLEQKNRPMTYRETAPALADYLAEMGFTHVEFLPLKGHPYGGSWGYQVANYYAPTARYGDPDDFRHLVDHLHGRGFGVIMDWVPAHFPKDAWSLGRFDGTALYEHLDPRKGEHPDWGTYIFNYGRNEVRNFLTANALYWLEEFHIDGLRVDAVASMLYLDYSREDGRWVPNKYGGRENLEAIEFLKELNTLAHELHPGALMIAEESTAWPKVSRPVREGGLGFDFKWNMGWMHDTLSYFQREPRYRPWHHKDLTFGLVYAWSENFILPFSHDEVVHMKGSMLNKMAARTVGEKFASLRALYAYMWSHPGKQLLFMGAELAQWREWNDDQSIDWHLLDDARHAGVRLLVKDLNRIYGSEPALWEADAEPAGFEWIDANASAESVVAFIRNAPRAARRLVVVANFSDTERRGYRLALPAAGSYRVVLSTDAPAYGGPGAFMIRSVEAEPREWHTRPCSTEIDLPPLTTIWLEVPAEEQAAAETAKDEETDGAATAKAGRTKKGRAKNDEAKNEDAKEGDVKGAATAAGGGATETATPTAMPRGRAAKATKRAAKKRATETEAAPPATGSDATPRASKKGGATGRAAGKARKKKGV